MGKRKKPPKRLVLAFDPGASAGIALYKDGTFVGSASVNGTSHRALMRAASNLIEAASGWDIPSESRLAVIEDGFGRGIGAKTLDRRRGFCAAAAESCGIEEVRYVYPSTWHSRMFVATESAAMKSEAMAWCKQNLDSYPATHDEAEACVLGYFVVHHAT